MQMRNECECVSASVNASVNVSVSEDSMRQFRYLLHFRQGAWQGRTADRSISAAQRRVRMHLLATFAATTNLPSPPPPSPYPLPLLLSLLAVTAFAFHFRRAFYPIN